MARLVRTIAPLRQTLGRYLRSGRSIHSRTTDEGIFKISDEVNEALRSGLPVVALESTIISHGMPFPQNLETAVNVEKVIRDHGAIPATISVLDGNVCVGISRSQLVGSACNRAF